MIDKKSVRSTFWLFLAPSLLAFVLVIIVPFFVGIYYSLTQWNAIPGNPIIFVGMENFKKIFSTSNFWFSLGQTVRFTILSVLSINVIGFSLALLVTQNLKGSHIMRMLYFLPNLIGGLILGFIWRSIFLKISPALYEVVPLPLFNVNWLGEVNPGIMAMVIVTAWQMAGYTMVIYIAGLQSIPEAMIEAARIDGAGALKRLRHIILPLVAPAFTISLFFTISSSFKMFDVNYSLTGGNPQGLTQLLALNIVDTAFTRDMFGLGQAKAVIFFLLVAAIGIVQVYYSKRREVEL